MIPALAPTGDILVDSSEPDDIAPSDDGVVLQLDNGNVVVDIRENVRDDDDKPSKFDDNLALKMPAGDLGPIANALIEGIQADIQSRSEWVETRKKGMELLGLKIEPPGTEAGSSSAPLEGMSRVRHPLLCEALIRFWANACGELYPTDGPVKVVTDGSETADAEEIAENFEGDFNYYLTVTSPEYYPDSKRNIFWAGFGGCGFKKVYHHPLKRRPVSETVDANDIIVSNSAPDLADCQRVTHQITMRPSVMKRMQLLGVYRDVALGQPTLEPNAADQKKESIEGIRSRQDRPEDQPYTLYECYCEQDFDEFAPKQFKGKGVALPYRVTLDKDSQEILEIRRNWNEDDPECLAKEYLVKYPFIDAFGLYGIGLVHVLGNSTNALTAAWREMLDAGMFANFPGFVYLKSAGKQLTNEFRVPPGGGIGIDSAVGDVRQAVMPVPFKDVSPGLLGLVDKVTEASQRLGGTADLPVGEGKQDAPVGTTLALIEQATKIESQIHKGLHTAQAREFQLLKERFREDPEAFWRHNPQCEGQWDKPKLLAALDNCKITPVADPNTPSHMHRIAKALAIKQLQAANPQLYDGKAVDTRVLKMIKVDDPESLFAPPSPATDQPDPNAIAANAKLIAAQTAQAKLQLDAQTKGADLQSKAADRTSKESIASVNLAKELVIHGQDHSLAKQQLVGDQAMAARQHALDQVTAARDHDLGMRQHGLDRAQAVHDAMMDANQQLADGGEVKSEKSEKSGKKPAPQPQPAFHPSMIGAQQAPDGNHYLPDPSRPGKWLRVLH